jgi:apolipoprotein N-acyltransferase
VLIAAWVMPVFLLFFTRKITARWQWLVFWCLFSASFNTAMDGFSPFPGIYFFPASLFYSVGWVLIYYLDHRLSKYGSSFFLTLFFPSGMVAYDFLLDHFPSGNLMSFAHSQYDFSQLMQLISLTGLWGITFLINWVAAMTIWIVDVRGNSVHLVRSTSFLLLVIAIVLGAGSMRLANAPSFSDTVRVAGVIETGSNEKTEAIFDQLVWKKEFESNFLRDVKDHSIATSDLLLDMAIEQAKDGAKIIVWPETAVLTLAEDEPGIIDKAAKIAKKHGVYIGMGLGSYDTSQSNTGKPMRNHFVMVTPEGDIAFDYDKQKLVPFVDQKMDPGSGQLPVIDTPYGRLGAWICLDASQSSITAQAIRQDVDIVVSPGLDWQGTAPEITKTSLSRATEYGVSLIRVVQWGLSKAVDPYGRMLGENRYTEEDANFAVDMPTQRIPTFYTTFGNWLAWISLAVFVMGAGIAVRWRT